MPRRLDAVDVAVRDSTRLVDVQRQFRDGVRATQVRKRSDSFRSSRFPVEPDPETARYRPERAAADRLWRVLRKRSASGAVDATVVASALRVEDVSQLFGDRDVLHRRDFVDTIAPLLKLSSSAPLRSNARRAAFVEPGDARPGSALLERDVYQSLSADTTPVTATAATSSPGDGSTTGRATRA